MRTRKNDRSARARGSISSWCRPRPWPLGRGGRVDVVGAAVLVQAGHVVRGPPVGQPLEPRGDVRAPDCGQHDGLVERRTSRPRPRAAAPRSCTAAAAGSPRGPRSSRSRGSATPEQRQVVPGSLLGCSSAATRVVPVGEHAPRTRLRAGPVRRPATRRAARRPGSPPPRASPDGLNSKCLGSLQSRIRDRVVRDVSVFFLQRVF